MSGVAALAGLVGIYEKSLPEANGSDFSELFDLAARSGYGFFELSIDESAERLDRLTWSADQRSRLADASRSAGLPIGTICLSAHRAHPMGSADPNRRAKSLELAAQAVRLAADLGAPLVQLAGYFTFYEPRHPGSRQHFLEGLAATADLARALGVRLSIENVDGHDVTTVDQAIALVRDSSTEDVTGLYVDVGNNIGNGHDPVHELTKAWKFVDVIQLKDARRGEFRRVPFGEGQVPWKRLFRFLSDRHFDGPVSVEMWNDDGDPDLARNALGYLRGEGLDALRP